MKKINTSLFFTILLLIAKAQNEDFCALNDPMDAPCVSFDLDISVLKSSFNHLFDSTDYFSTAALKSLHVIAYDSMPITSFNGVDSVLNETEITMLLRYENESLSRIAFKDLLYHLENFGSTNFYLFIKSGIVCGINENEIALYHPKGSTNVNRQDLLAISRKFEQLEFVDVHLVWGQLEKYER